MVERAVDLGSVTRKAEANRLIGYHAPISAALTEERTSLESKLIPVTAYIVVACVESWLRYPDMMRRIDAALLAEEIGRAGRRPGSRVNTVSLWSIANFWLLGRKVMAQIDPGNDPVDAAHTVLDFWERSARGFRGDGTHQAWDAGGVVRPYGPTVLDALTEGLVPVDDELRSRSKTFNATLVTYLFLLYFDTRVGAGDAGPYRLPDGRTLLVRDYYRLAESDFWWSDVAKDVPYRNLTAALVLDDVAVRITDFGTANTSPEDYLDRLVGFALFTTDTPDRSLRPVALDELEGIVGAVRAAQSQLYRNIAAMDRDEKIRCGAYVYFSLLKPFADVAGVGDDLDWTVPLDIPPPLYDLLAAMEGENAGIADEGPYYEQIS
ncbi:hypothetical protein BH24ACT3_BH24ACT3_18310 [soil metagenome]